MSSEWPLVTIEDVCELIVDCVNKTAPVSLKATPYRMIRTTNVRNGRIDLSDCRCVEQETYEKWTRRAKLQFGDVILTREAPIGEVGLVKEHEGVFLGQRLMQYRADPKRLDSRFLLYSFLSPGLQHQFRSHEGSGSVVSHIRVGDCFKFKLRLPPLLIQKEIATFLGALDDRIALLRETNATLEAIAQALFKSWFVDFDPVHAKARGEPPQGMDDTTAALFPASFEESELGMIPKGWRVGSLAELCSISSGKRPPERSDNRTEECPIPLYGGAGLMGYTSTVLFDAQRIVTGRVGTLGKVHIAYPPFWASDNVLVLTPVDISVFIFCLLWLRSIDVISLNRGSTQPLLTQRDLGAQLGVIPEQNTLAAFESVTSPIYAQIRAQEQQAQTLAQLRDTLLPKLISGQLRLPEAEELLAEELP